MDSNSAPERAERCTGCRFELRTSDWTCPWCGAIKDRFLFRTITRKSVTGPAKDAFAAGQRDCQLQWNQTGSAEINVYRPTPALETSYRAGWQDAAES